MCLPLQMLMLKNLCLKGGLICHLKISAARLNLLKLNLENKANDLEYRYVDSMPFVPSDDAKRKNVARKYLQFRHPALLKELSMLAQTVLL